MYCGVYNICRSDIHDNNKHKEQDVKNENILFEGSYIIWNMV